MHEPEVTDDMLFRLIIEHRDLFHLLAPYMRPGFSITFRMPPFGSTGPLFNFVITKCTKVSTYNEPMPQWEVFGDGSTIEEAAGAVVKAARLH